MESLPRIGSNIIVISQLICSLIEKQCGECRYACIALQYIVFLGNGKFVQYSEIRMVICALKNCVHFGFAQVVYLTGHGSTVSLIISLIYISLLSWLNPMEKWTAQLFLLHPT